MRLQRRITTAARCRTRYSSRRLVVGAKSGKTYSAAPLSAFGEDLTHHCPPPPTFSTSSSFFTGKPAVAGLGHAFLMRNYRASLGKWQTADPMGYPENAPKKLRFGGKPRAQRSARRARKGPRWNALAYCKNSVLENVDLYGCFPIDTIIQREINTRLQRISADFVSDIIVGFF